MFSAHVELGRCILRPDNRAVRASKDDLSGLGPVTGGGALWATGTL